MDVHDGQIAYDSKMGGVEYNWEDYFAVGRLLGLGFKQCAYEIAAEGKPLYGEGVLNFMESKYKEPQTVKTYDFEKYTNRVHKGKSKSNKKADTEDFGTGPVKTDITDSKYLFDNQDAISIKIDKK